MPYQYTPSDHARFWTKVDTSAGCWTWTAGMSKSGYGKFWAGGRTLRASRAAWELTNGPIPDGLLVCHHCDNPACVRPDHLFLGTSKDNAQDMRAKGRASKALHLIANPTRGDAHWTRRFPERLARGDQNWARRFPELVRRGQDSPHAKLTDDDVREMRRLWDARRMMQRDIAARFGVSELTVNRIVNRRAWQHVA